MTGWKVAPLLDLAGTKARSLSPAACAAKTAVARGLYVRERIPIAFKHTNRKAPQSQTALSYRAAPLPE